MGNLDARRPLVLNEFGIQRSQNDFRLKIRDYASIRKLPVNYENP